jgi:hypothetical protein
MPDVAFVIEHAYVDALACFREAIKAFAAHGYGVDVYTPLSQWHPSPTFVEPGIRLIPLSITYGGTARLLLDLVTRRPKYAAVFTVPQWSLHYAAMATRMSRTRLVYISDELRTMGNRARELREHRQCAFTIALSPERAAYVREANALPADHPIYVVPNAPPGPAARQASRYYQDLLSIPHDRCILLHAGGMGWSPIATLADTAARWGDDQPALVFQGRLPSEMRGRTHRGSVWFSPITLPADLLNYAASSARIGLALYDDVKVNDRLMGTASGKLCLYMRNALPVITTRQECFSWVEHEHCGLRVGSADEIPDAARAIEADYDAYTCNVRRYYAEHLDFTRTFAPVLAAVDALAGS